MNNVIDLSAKRPICVQCNKYIATKAIFSHNRNFQTCHRCKTASRSTEKNHLTLITKDCAYFILNTLGNHKNDSSDI